MSDFDVLVKDAEIRTAADALRGDIGIIDGRVAAIGALPGSADQVIDAAGRIVTPGGVDAHCHLDQPMSDGAVMADDFISGTASAAHGGTTTVIPFACQMAGQGLHDAVDDYHRRADGKAFIDYAFHLIVTSPTRTVLDNELPELINNGYPHFKVYMTYEDMKLNDRQILDVLAVARREGALPMIHAENDDCISWLTDLLEQAGRTAPRYHASARPPVIEREAAHRAISLSELVEVPVLIVHVSGREAMQQIQSAQNRGVPIHAETCPQYLFLTADDLGAPGFEGAKHICSPPPRTAADQEHIWTGLKSGVFDVFSSDHAPFRFADSKGKQRQGEETPFRQVPNGVPGIETRLALLMSEGVQKGRIDIHRFVSLTSTGPAKLYGLYPRKGSVVPGGDADLVIWNTEDRVTIRNESLHHNVDYTPYEGMELNAWPETVLCRGRVVVTEGELQVEQGYGEFQKGQARPGMAAFDPVQGRVDGVDT